MWGGRLLPPPPRILCDDRDLSPSYIGGEGAGQAGGGGMIRFRGVATSDIYIYIYIPTPDKCEWLAYSSQSLEIIRLSL